MAYKPTILVVITLLISALPSHGADVAIGLFYNRDVQSVVFSTVEGEYLLTGNGRQVAVIRQGDILHIERTASGMEVHDTLQSYGVFANLVFTGVSGNNVFQVKPVFPALPAKESDDDLSVSPFNDALLLINRLSLEKYIPGTVETEGGSNAGTEYYKAQAVLTRTFAVKNFHRHAHEGFNLCDGVHCQAFNGKSRMNARIYTAARSTQDEILTDRTGSPIIAAYHACCGGITGTASTEWNRDLPYLRPVRDPFCVKSEHRNWIKSITLADWNAYLQKKGYFGEPESLYGTDEMGRQKYLDRENNKLQLTEIRNDLKLKSSFFHVEPGNGSVALRGHGYGHGLGMCQEGAMEMARVGYTYVDILMFYFSHVKIARNDSPDQSTPAP
jgi:stage II sporulation protein D